MGVVLVSIRNRPIPEWRRRGQFEIGAIEVNDVQRRPKSEFGIFECFKDI